MKAKCEDTTIFFYREDKQIHLEYHNKCLYVIASILDVELRRGLVNLGSSLNITPISAIEEVGIRWENWLNNRLEILALEEMRPWHLVVFWSSSGSNPSNYSLSCHQCSYYLTIAPQKALDPYAPSHALHLAAIGQSYMERKKGACKCVWGTITEKWGALLESCILQRAKENEKLLQLVLEMCHFIMGGPMSKQ